MAEDQMRYDLLAQDALRSVVRLALKRVEKDGLPGEHHFFIAVATTHPGVRISDRLRKKYETEMTVVLQHQFWNLQVFDHFFEVELSFDNTLEQLVIPFDAVKGFFDPHVQFGLQFEVSEAPEIEETDSTGQASDITADSQPEIEETSGSVPSIPARPAAKDNLENPDEEKAKPSNDDTTVVSLDSFRKK